MAKATRVGCIDFWRGCVLIAILVDHIPGNLLEWSTPRNYGLSDSSEAFVFISGLSVGMVYAPRAGKQGLASVALGCVRRALKLYGVHLAITLTALVIFAAAYQMSGVDDLIEAHGRALVFASPASGLASLAMLSHQLGYFNILPMYMVLMLWAPVALALAMRSVGMTFLASAGVYAASRAGLHLPNWPEPGGWFFNPFAWQLVFTLGVISAVLWGRGPPQARPELVLASVAAIVACALTVTGAAGMVPGLRDTVFAHLDIAKQDLGLARLVHFAALAYLLSTTPGLAGLVESRLGAAVQGLGRHGLPVFAVGSLLSALAQAAIAATSPYASAGVEHLAGFAYTLIGVAFLFVLVRRIECRSSLSPSSAVMPTSSPAPSG
jgi:hypothetical protein